MISIRSRIIKCFLVKGIMKNAFDPFQSSIDKIRRKTAKMNRRIKLPKNTPIEAVRIGDIGAEWISPPGSTTKSECVVLYLHSGAFCFGYGNNHRDFALRLSNSSNTKVLAVDYRLAPENPYPAANEDCLAVYQWLLENGYSPQKIIMGGDSAGAALALMTALTIRDQGIPLPKACFFLSMMGGDLRDFDGDSYQSRKNRDPYNTKEVIKRYGEIYLNNASIEPPIKQNLKGLPDMFIQVGDDEVLLSDSVLLAQRAVKAGIRVDMEVWKGMWHVFQGFAMIMPEAKRAIDNLGRFIEEQLGIKDKPDMLPNGRK